MPFFVKPDRAQALCATVQAKLIDPNLDSPRMEFIESHSGEEQLVCRAST
jgi:hypothetical protein